MDPALTHAAVGQSRRRDPLAAGAEAAAEAVAKLGGAAPRLVLVFATTGYDQQPLLDGVRQVTGDAPLSGCSGEGIITQAGSDEGSHAVAVLALAHPALRARTAQVTGVSKDPDGAAARLAALLSDAPRPPGLVLLFADGITFDCGRFLGELERRLPTPLTLVGGTAGTELGSFSTWTTWQYHDGRAASDAVSAVVLEGAVAAELSVHHGCQGMGLELMVTRSDGATVAELDGRPTFSVLKEFLDSDAQDLSANADLHLVVGVPLPGGPAEGYGDLLLRSPMRLDPASGAVFFTGGGLEEGKRIQLVRRDVDQMREGAERAARELAARRPGQRPFLVLQFDCTGRGRVLCGERTTAIVVDPLQAVLGKDLPWIGFHTFGEIAPLGGAARYHACTVALCALYAVPADP